MLATIQSKLDEVNITTTEFVRDFLQFRVSILEEVQTEDLPSIGRRTAESERSDLRITSSVLQGIAPLKTSTMLARIGLSATEAGVKAASLTAMKVLGVVAVPMDICLTVVEIVHLVQKYKRGSPVADEIQKYIDKIR